MSARFVEEHDLNSTAPLNPQAPALSWQLLARQYGAPAVRVD